MPRKGGLLDEYIQALAGRTVSTIETYRRELGQFLHWIGSRPGNSQRFRADQLTATALETYLAQLGAEGHSISHRARVKSAVGGFARWLIEEKSLLRRNPARQVTIPPQPLLAPRELTVDQRYVLRSLVEREDDCRGAALFALGYWAGCRVSDVAWLRAQHVHVGPKVGWIHVGYKGVRGGQDGATFWEPLWAPSAGAFPSSLIVPKRSSPSRVRFAAPNNGAPLTAPGRSEQAVLSRGKGSNRKAGPQTPPSPPKWYPFSPPPT